MNNFKLSKITEIYKALKENPDLDYYFLDSENNPIKVQKIEKVKYSGKIYDVDVPNDIVLVKRNGKAVWSGNSNTKAVDISKYGNNGTVKGSALKFDGVDDYVDCGNDSSLDITNAITIEAWVKPASLPTDYDHPIVSKGWNYAGGWTLSIRNEGDWEFAIKDQSLNFYPVDGGTTNTQWNHLVGVWDGSNVWLYVNGNKYGPTPTTGTIGNNYDVFISKYEMPTPVLCFHGTIDEVRIYNRALSAEEIKMHYLSEFQKYNSTEWRFYDNVTGLTKSGTYTYYGWASDTAGNSAYTTDYTAESPRYLNVDVTPKLNFTSPTEDNGTTINRNWAEANITIDDPDGNLDTFKFNWNTTNYTFYDSSLVLAMNFNNNSEIGECYDEQMQILTEEGWKFFNDLKGTEKVMTLNSKTKKSEWQKPMDYAVFNSSGEMYEITLEDGSKLLVSPEHRVYGKIIDQSSLRFLNSDQSISNFGLISANSFLSSSKLDVLDLNSPICMNNPADINSDIISSSGEWRTPSTIKSNRINPISINDQAITSSIVCRYLFIFYPNLLTINPTATPIDIPTNVLKTRSYWNNRYKANAITTDTETPTKKPLSSFNAILKLLRNFKATRLQSNLDVLYNNQDKYKNSFSLLKISDLYEELSEDKALIFLDSSKNPVKS